MPPPSVDAGARPRVLVLNQYYWPGVEATAHLLAELCEALADEFDVTVVTGMVRRHDDAGRPSRTASSHPRRLDRVRPEQALAAGGELPDVSRGLAGEALRSSGRTSCCA